MANKWILGKHKKDTMNDGMYELVQKILYAVSFIAIGGTLVIVFFFVFAPSILGLRTIHKQLENLRRQTEQMNEQFRKIADHLKDTARKVPNNSHGATDNAQSGED